MAFSKMPIISKPNTDGFGNPQLIQVTNEAHEIFKNKIVLDGIPDKFSRVIITDDDETIYVEKFDTDTLIGNQFKVNYSDGVINFPVTLEGKSVLVSYYSKGIELVSAERIYTKLGDNGDVVETLDDKVAEMIIMKQNYDNATHVEMVSKVILEYTATQDTTSFILDANNYNPLIDMLWLYYKNTILLENKQYVITGTTVTLNEWTLPQGDTIDIVVERAVKDLPPAGTNGADLMLGSVGENKLSTDVQLKLNKTIVIQDYTFTATQDNTTTFTIESDIFNPVTDVLDVYRENLKLSKDINYSLLGQTVTLANPLNIGDFVEYRITKNTSNSVPFMSDGSLLQNRSVPKRKLNLDLQAEITKATTNEIEIMNARRGKTNLVTKIIEMDDFISDNEIKIDNFKIVNVRDFGAVGDGTADDGEKIQDAIDYAVANDISGVRVPEGIYYTTTSIDTKGIKLQGDGKPYIPFLTWDYTLPSSTLNAYNDYKAQCKGSIFTTDKNITIFSTGLFAENIGLFGNRRATTQYGISQTLGGQQIILKDCSIIGFSNHGIYAPYGLIGLILEDCKIEQNGVNGIYIDKQLGGYTGETNLLIIKRCSIIRNESHGIFGNLLGRSICIQNTNFERNGEPDDPNRPKPTDVGNIVFGCVLNLYKSGGFSNGAFDFSDNYSEGAYGLLKLNAVNPCGAISIKNNFWYPRNHDYYSCFASISGWIFGLTIKDNNVYTIFDTVRFESGSTIRNVDIDIPYTGLIYNDSYPNREVCDTGNATFVNTVSNGVQSIHTFSVGFATSFAYDSGANVTYIYLNAAKISGTTWDGYDMGLDSNNKHNGMAVKVGGGFVGVIQAVSSTNKVLSVRGNRSLLPIGDGSVEIVRLGGIETVGGAGQRVKLVVDWDGTILTTGK